MTSPALKKELTIISSWNRSCKLYYHMTCVKPALAAKPARGYSWICLPCTLHQHEAKIRGETPIPVISSGPRKTLPGGRNKAISKLGLGVDSNVDDTRPDVFYRGWNLRYFGLYTIAADTMGESFASLTLLYLLYISN